MRDVIEDKMDKMINLLKEILTWLKIAEYNNVKKLLLNTLKEDMDKIIYHLSDGKSSRKIAKKIPVSHATVVNYWKKWIEIGIVEPVSTRGGISYKKVFSLEDFGIEIPEIK